MPKRTHGGNPLSAHGMSDEAFDALWEQSTVCPYLHAFRASCEISGRSFADIAAEVLVALSKAHINAVDLAIKLSAFQPGPVIMVRDES